MSIRRKRPNKFSAGRMVQMIVSFAPVTASALQAGQDSGGLLTQAGLTRGVLPTITKAYGLYNTNTKQFDTTGALEGYPMLVAGYLARRLTTRLMK